MKAIQPPDKEYIVALGDRYSLERAAELCGVHVSTFAKWWRNAVPDSKRKTGKKPSVPPPTKTELLEALKDRSNTEAAEYFGVSYHTFNKWLKDYNITSRYFDHDRMVSLAELARIMGLSRMAVSRRFRLGQIPGAKKVNGTRVSVPASILQRLENASRDRRTISFEEFSNLMDTEKECIEFAVEDGRHENALQTA